MLFTYCSIAFDINNVVYVLVYSSVHMLTLAGSFPLHLLHLHSLLPLQNIFLIATVNLFPLQIQTDGSPAFVELLLHTLMLSSFAVDKNYCLQLWCLFGSVQL